MRKAKKANKKVPERWTHSSSDTTPNDFERSAMATISKVNNNERGVKPKVVPKQGAVAGQKHKLTNLHDQPSIKSKKNTNSSSQESVDSEAETTVQAACLHDDSDTQHGGQGYNVSFVDEDQMIEFEVTEPDNFYQSDENDSQTSEEPEQEISFRQTDQSDVSEVEQDWDHIEGRSSDLQPGTSTSTRAIERDQGDSKRLMEK